MGKCNRKCSECDYAKPSGYCKHGTTNMRKFYCGHPNQDFILRAFQKKGYKGQVGYVGMGHAFSDKPDTKSAPPWCPLKDLRNRR